MKSRHSLEAFSLDEPAITYDGQMIFDPPSKEQSAVNMLEQREVRQKLQNCVEALADDFREIPVLRYLQDFSYNEIGSMLKMP
jgi:RNA polymerase sigma-70 factor, ECF subfamily